MPYRMYVDETGDHAACPNPEAGEGKRYLGLVGVVIRQGDVYSRLVSDLESFKQRHLTYDPDAPPILHRTEIVNRRGAFGILKDDVRRNAFDRDLLDLIAATKFKVVCVVIDKFSAGQATYRRLTHPYSYSLLGLLERYCGWLDYADETGDLLAEARGGPEDLQFKKAYREFWESGAGGAGYLSGSIARATLTTREAKLKPKSTNIAGLQLADLLAHPLTRDVLVAYRHRSDRGGEFADRIAEIAISSKYNRKAYGNVINGYGRKLLE